MSNMATVTSKINNSNIMFDDGPASKLRIGMIILDTDMTIELDYRLALRDRDDIGIYFNRVQFGGTLTKSKLQETESDLSRASKAILPEGGLDVIAYGCTSAGAAIGVERLYDILLQGQTNNVKCSTPLVAAVKAMKALKATRVAIITPYSVEICEPLIRYINQNNIEVVASKNLALARDWDVAHLSPSAIYDIVTKMDQNGADVIFISCTGLRATRLIPQLEAAVQKPVITSNQVLLWDCLRLGGVTDSIKEYGQLFDI